MKIDTGKEEAKISIKENDINENGVPFIMVIVEGVRSKRSYKNGYNTLTGVVSKYDQFHFTYM